jgi:CelD/BcsL family acetyltransferase involved in cellulose biosynthesis
LSRNALTPPAPLPEQLCRNDIATTRYATMRFADCGPPLVAEWQALAESGGFNPTLMPRWLSIIVAALCPDDIQVDLLVRREPGGIVSAVLPYLLSDKRMLGVRVSVLQPGSNLMSYHADVIATAGVEEVLEALLKKTSDWDVFHFANVPLESAAASALHALAPRFGAWLQVIEGDESPYLAINGTWASYFGSRSKKFRYKHRQRRELFGNDPVFMLRWFNGPGEVDRLLADMLVVEQRSWKSEAGLSIATRELELEYHRRLLPVLAQEGVLLANVLYRAERPIAYSLCCRCQGWIGHLKTSFDQEFSSLSPGGYVIDASVERAFDLGAKEFDFLGDAAPHKLAWTSSTRKHGDFFLFGRTLKGRMIGNIKRWSEQRRTVTR